MGSNTGTCALRMGAVVDYDTKNYHYYRPLVESHPDPLYMLADKKDIQEALKNLADYSVFPTLRERVIVSSRHEPIPLCL